jgi:hypothetical protein
VPAATFWVVYDRLKEANIRKTAAANIETMHNATSSSIMVNPRLEDAAGGSTLVNLNKNRFFISRFRV